MCRAVIWTRTGRNRSKLLRLPLLTVTPVLLLPFYSDSVQQRYSVIDECVSDRKLKKGIEIRAKLTV